ncbi:hypothetical protein D1818_07870 [Aquimarina sp. BL5]|uniref:hypothetical protein n=1 Tax=Aquimarina sp. BL5 TaxID=1714860 RepID=UPI000E4CD92E|nr:hypothetical protein [Aquimarina sp. BL5]AXT50750.1 hypothetical protein D1818_07870 [Aquimarina sp. BL5]RKN08227.1 hypothetical protein D7036_06295 [Aquimarina sp. BL5]
MTHNNTGVIVSATYSYRELTVASTEYYHVCGGCATAVVVNSNVAKPTPLPEGFVDISNSADTSIFPADCRSFKYAPFTGVNIATTTGINDEFYADHTVVNGVVRRTIELSIDIATFTAPSYLRPGQAANVTAGVITGANYKTQLSFLQNTGASSDQLKIQWEIYLKQGMQSIGGSIVIGENVYGIRSPAPYLITVGPTNCD